LFYKCISDNTIGQLPPQWFSSPLSQALSEYWQPLMDIAGLYNSTNRDYRITSFTITSDPLVATIQFEAMSSTANVSPDAVPGGLVAATVKGAFLTKPESVMDNTLKNYAGSFGIPIAIDATRTILTFNTTPATPGYTTSYKSWAVGHKCVFRFDVPGIYTVTAVDYALGTITVTPPISTNGTTDVLVTPIRGIGMYTNAASLTGLGGAIKNCKIRKNTISSADTVVSIAAPYRSYIDIKNDSASIIIEDNDIEYVSLNLAASSSNIAGNIALPAINVNTLSGSNTFSLLLPPSTYQIANYLNPTTNITYTCLSLSATSIPTPFNSFVVGDIVYFNQYPDLFKIVAFTNDTTISINCVKYSPETGDLPATDKFDFTYSGATLPLLRACCVDPAIGTSSKYGIDSLIIRNNRMNKFNSFMGRSSLFGCQGIYKLTIEGNTFVYAGLYRCVDVLNAYNISFKDNKTTCDTYPGCNQLDTTYRTPGMTCILTTKTTISTGSALFFIGGIHADIECNNFQTLPRRDDKSLLYTFLALRSAFNTININNNTVHGVSSTVAVGYAFRCDKLIVNNNQFLWNKNLLVNSFIIFGNLFSKSTMITNNKFENSSSTYPTDLLIGTTANAYTDLTLAYSELIVVNNIAKNRMTMISNTFDTPVYNFKPGYNFNMF
jgi:hypothetical protein